MNVSSLHKAALVIFSFAFCASLVANVTSLIAQPLSANAGPATAEVCDGNGIVLGGSPTVSGGSGFYMISWSSNPPGFSSSASNPVVIPTETTTYTVNVVDSDGAVESDDITVTVNPSTDPADLDIVFTPASNAYSIEGDPVDLSFTVTGGGGTGVFSGDGVNSTANKFYPNAGNLGANEITLTYTNADNCVTEITETVNVYDPNGFLGGLDPVYCPYGTDNLTINIPAPYVSFVDIFLEDPDEVNIPTGTAWSKNLAARTAQLNLAYLPLGRSTFNIVYTVIGIVGYNYTPFFDLTCLCVRFNITPIFGPVQAIVEVPLLITPQPETKIAFKASTPEFCRNAEPINMEGGPVGGVWFGPGVTPAPGNDGNPAQGTGDNGVASFDPSVAGPGVFQISYLYENAVGCRDTSQVNFTVFDVPVPDFTAANGCVGAPVEFNSTVTIPPTVTAVAYSWDFDDDTRETSTVFSTPTYHKYISSNDYDVTFSVLSAQGCLASVTKQVSIGDIPDLDLAWSSVCEGDPTRFEFTSNFFSTNPGDLSSITWDFGDGPGNPVVQNNPGPGSNVRFHTYTTNGKFDAAVLLETDLGCSVSDTVDVYKVARTVPIFGLTEYQENFDDAMFEDQQWISGGQNSSWEWGVPANLLIDDDATGGGKVWATNLDGSFEVNERSWVHSPCVDLTQIERPVISLDIRSLTRNKVDGAVLQVNYTGMMATGWQTVGAVGQGAEWYNAAGVFSNPGDQVLNQYGWTGQIDSMEWRTAVYPLDNLLNPLTPLQRSRIRFRIAFSSPASQSDADALPTEEGFAFDNVRIAQRDRIVLIETFTNSGGANTPDEENKQFNDAINVFVGSSTGEVTKLEYHVGFDGPGEDPLYHDNTTDANARAAFYGVSSAPFGFIDGKTGTNLFSLYSQQTLKTADVVIDDISTNPAPSESLNVSVTFTTKTDLPPSTVLHIAVVEKTIDAPEALGSNGETQFEYVMKKMLPDALGTAFPSGVAQNTSHTVNLSWAPQAYQLDNLAIIAFLQDENTGVVFQAGIIESPSDNPVDVVTGIEPGFENLFLVYPIPADQELRFSVPVTGNQPCGYRLFDMFGKTAAYGTVETGRASAEIGVAGLAGGMYTLEISVPGYPPVRKKIIIVHR